MKASFASLLLGLSGMFCGAIAQEKAIPELLALKGQYDGKLKAEAQQPYDEGVVDLNIKYTAALDRALTTSQSAGKLEEALAVKGEKEAIALGKGVPAEDEEKTPAMLKQLRVTYRATISRLDDERQRKLQPLQAAYAKSLDSLVTTLTKEGKLDQALAVKKQRDDLSAATPVPPPQTLGRPPAAPSSLAATTKEAPFVNMLGMKFVPVPGTTILMCIHETRKGDYAAYSDATPGVAGGWKSAHEGGVPASTADDHPVVEMGWGDAVAFCSWLSNKEGRIYRLPTDREWSLAAGLTREAKDVTPESLNGKAKDEYPWGRKWPPGKGAANLADESYKGKFPNYPSIAKYADGYATTSPVMSFEPNKLGLYDLGGNASEWCQEWYNPSQKHRVMRGGSWFSGETDSCLSSAREAASVRTPFRGFRCVLEITP